jgi:WhiB family transcriptional regulator, redox-sensing transcriptional regulator
MTTMLPVIPLDEQGGSRPAWRQHARCLGADPDTFYPENDEDEDFEGAEAKAICAMCPVAVECLEHAIAVREKFGVWGGLTPKERRRIIRRRRRQAAAIARSA